MRRSNRKLSPPVAAAATAALCAIPSLAAADDLGPTISSGVAFSASFGRQIEIGISLDLRLTVILQGDPYSSCPYESRSGIGPYGQAGWYSKTGWRFGAGTQGGTEIRGNTYGVAAEFGWSYLRRAATLPLSRLDPRALDSELPGLRLGRPAKTVGSHALHFGFLAQFAPPQAMVVGVQLPLGLDIPVSAFDRGPLFTAGAGIRVPTMFGIPVEGCSMFGRPLRQEGELILPAVALGGPCEQRALDETSAAALAEAWLRDARFECGSVSAFLALARDLAAVGAPPELVTRALAAADEEARHTALCSRLASGFAGVVLTPLLPPLPVPRDGSQKAALCRLAQEAWLDGCINEGAAAAQAARALHLASDEASRHALSIIARDEAGHAELSFAVLAFCLQAGGHKVRETVAPLMRAPNLAPSAPEVAVDADPTLLRAHGRLLPGEAEFIRQQTELHARARGEYLI